MAVGDKILASGSFPLVFKFISFSVIFIWFKMFRSGTITSALLGCSSVSVLVLTSSVAKSMTIGTRVLGGAITASSAFFSSIFSVDTTSLLGVSGYSIRGSTSTMLAAAASCLTGEALLLPSSFAEACDLVRLLRILY